MIKDKAYYADGWIKLADQANVAALYLLQAGRLMEAQRYYLVAEYCYRRHKKTANQITVLTRKTDRILNVLGLIFSIGIAALIVYLIINK